MEGAAPELLMDADEYLQPMGQMKENYTYQPSQGFAFPQVMKIFQQQRVAKTIPNICNWSHSMLMIMVFL